MSSASRPTPGLLLPARATDTGLGVLACERGGGRSQEGLGPGRLLRLDLVLVRAGRALPTAGAQGRQHAPASLPCRQLSPFFAGFRLARETVDVERRLEKETCSLGPALGLPARGKDAGI